MEQVSIISKSPIVLIQSGSIYTDLVQRLAIKLESLKSTPFEFVNRNNEKVKEKYRCSYLVNEVFDDVEILRLIKIFATKNTFKFIEKLKDEIYDEEYELKNKDLIRYCLRVRVFEDLEGYSLQPHRDSEDTILSFVLQLNTNNTKTALYKKNRQFKLPGISNNGIDKTRNKVIEAINKICPHENIFFGESQFRKNLGMWTEKKFFRYEEIEDWIGIQEFNEEIIKIPQNSIYAICNSFKGSINSMKLNTANDSSYHGVRPINQRSRKLLLMDLIARPSPQEVLIMQGVTNDKNSYYLIYGPEKCSELTGLLS